ncbi:MAG: hypothetical protein V4733_05950 [Verrucomicrobiota bacterium]
MSQPPPRLPGADPVYQKRARKIAAITTGIIVLTYAALFRFAFTLDIFRDAGGVVSLSFIISVPFACGALGVAIGRWCGSDNWVAQAIFTPLGALLLGLVICIVTRIEAIICVIMAAPILVVACALGGSTAHLLLPRHHPKPKLYCSIIFFIPLLAAHVEGLFTWPSETKSITNTITIHAPAARVWPEIASVPAIDPAMLRDSWIYKIGFPRPIAATLDRPGTGGIRTATFERDVSFFEVVTDWQENQRLAFTIHADPDFIPHTAFDQHIIVGGRFYDVLDGIYEIEPVSETTCRLHLTSHHRLTTRFNSYTAWWSAKIMNEIQGTILEVIRARAEGGS